MLGMGTVLALRALFLYGDRLPWMDRKELVERVDVLTRTRQGALDVQAAELRRIERDLHDGAQARLVALSMRLGRAEERLADQPEIAALVREAREDAGAAIGELRDLARGIAPPILADRGLTAAIEALARRSAIGVTIDADPDRRPLPVVETAAYFVVAEALTNVAKHAGGAAAHVRVTLEGDDVLVLEIADEGPGGADPAGSGLTGLRSRVEALDGRLVGGQPAPAGEPPCERSCHAGGDRRGPRAAARGDRRAAARERHRRRRAGRGRAGPAADRRRPQARRRDRRRAAAADVHRRGAARGDRGAPAPPGLGVLVVSQYVEPVYTAELLASGEAGVGYLLKERVGEVRAFIDAVERVAAGGTALDREVVAELMRARTAGGASDTALDELTPREREVLELMAEGRSNAAVARALVVSGGAVEKHVRNIFAKLDLPASNDDHRRVLAVLAYLRAGAA